MSPVFEAVSHKKRGKCHKYIPYEMRPRYRSGPKAKTVARADPGAPTTLANTHAVEAAARRNPPRKANASLTVTNVHRAMLARIPAIPTMT